MRHASAMVPFALMAGTVQAQTATGTLVPGRETSAMVSSPNARRGTIQSDAEGIKSTRAMARCMAGNHAAETGAILAAADEPAFDAAYRRGKNSVLSCMAMVEAYGDTAPVRMRFNPDTMRGLLAEALLHRAMLVALSPVVYEPGGAGSEWISDDPAARATLRAADCLAARQPAAVADVLATSPDSLADDRGFAAVMPHCVDRNVRLTTKKVGLRLALASAMDRRMRQSVPAAGGR